MDFPIKSESIPESLLNTKVMLGIDEAGRGPVLGPMVYGVAYWPICKNEEISSLGFDDSKSLTSEIREKMFHCIQSCEGLGWQVRIIHANEISHSMLSKTSNLNEISRNAAIELIEAVQNRGIEVAEVYVDTVGDPEVYEKFLFKKFHGTIKFTVAKKADSLYKVVGAASICAKVTRDRIMSSWKWDNGLLDLSTQFGSGYPSDPRTKEWLKNNLDHVFGYPNIVRFSWSTIDSYLQQIAIVKFPSDESSKSIKRHFNKETSSTEHQESARKRTKYFTDLHLEHVVSF